MNEKGAKKLVAESGVMLLREGLSARTWGNVSCRTGEHTMVITPSGLAYDGMTPEDIVSVDITTGEWEGKRKPSSEKGVHISAYSQLPDAGFVIHTHQTYASAIGLTGLDKLSFTDAENTALGGIALAEYGLPSTKKLTLNIFNAFKGGAHVVLMANHGTMIVGKDREEAFGRALLLEQVCQRACKGQPSDVTPIDTGKAKRLMDSAKRVFTHVSYISSPSVLACASGQKAIPAQLDDMAQMIGMRLSVVKPDENVLIKALKKKNIVLVPGVGAICRAATDGDLKALCLLAEKACICWLHTKASGVRARLSMFDTMLMRTVYLMKYSKKIGG